MQQERFERQQRLFGEDGQRKICKTHVGVVGVGGLGSHLVQQLAFLGVGAMTLVDNDTVEISNLNRLIGARHADAASHRKKVTVMQHLATSIDSGIRMTLVPHNLRTEEAFSGLTQCDYVFGCVDNDGTRLVLNELCIAYEKPYIDLASEVSVGSFGGRVFVNHDDGGCLYCCKEISLEEARRDLETPEARRTRQAVYGIDEGNLGGVGPSVVTVNGIVASLAATEFMVFVTGLRAPSRWLEYRGDLGGVVYKSERPPIFDDCYYCKSVRGLKKKAGLNRLLQ